MQRIVRGNLQGVVPPPVLQGTGAGRKESTPRRRGLLFQAFAARREI